MIGAFQFVLDTPICSCVLKRREIVKRLAAYQSHGSSTPLTVCQSRPHCLWRFYHARTMTGREYHYPLCRSWRSWEQSNILSRHLSLIPFGSRGVPLHTLMLITITKRTYLTKWVFNFQGAIPFSPHRKQGERILSSHPIADGNTRNIRWLKNIF